MRAKPVIRNVRDRVDHMFSRPLRKPGAPAPFASPDRCIAAENGAGGSPCHERQDPWQKHPARV
jgi:hypothetical protein